MSWLCEFCYVTTAGEQLPDDWDWVFQSAVCPSCKARVAADGGYHVVLAGAYAGDRPDPRDREIASAVAAAQAITESLP